MPMALFQKGVSVTATAWMLALVAVERGVEEEAAASSQAARVDHFPILQVGYHAAPRLHAEGVACDVAADFTSDRRRLRR